MSAIVVTLCMVFNFMIVCGLELYTTEDNHLQGEKTLCAQLYCIEDATSESEISSLVNMSVYRIDGDARTPLASISASDSRVRDYNVDGVEVDGKISTKTVEMTVLRRSGLSEHNAQYIRYSSRTKPPTDFHQYWSNYKDGFGDVSGDFWLGNDLISKLTLNGYTDLRIDIKYTKNQYYALYRNFTVGNETTKYQMSYSSFEGNVTDGLRDHNGMNFSTKDKDNDQWQEGNCVSSHTGGWWFNNCLTANLNGVWASKEFGKGVHWENVTSLHESLEYTEMKLRLPL
ncbi:techylectin-5B-like [Physella acuta]|uniref:techylectin-5B-like n=1 Tax=Physella acuta TaxID=109671 RepID=UPI0027DC9611|nr:techylectin-5B-like [Physella acuta]